MRRAFSNPVDKASRLAPLAAEPAALTRPCRPARLLSLVVPAAVLGLWVGPAAAQTLTISPTGSVNVTEGDTATAFSVTVADLPQDSTARAGALEIKKTGGVTSGDFKLYDSDPSMGSPTALAIVDSPSTVLPHLYYVQWNMGPPSTETTFNYWIEVPDDSVLAEGVESIEITFLTIASVTTPPTAESETLTLNVTDSPLPAPTAKPTMPANLRATAGKGAVTLTWDPVDATSSNTNLLNDIQITKHQVQQSTDGGTNYGTWTDIPDSAYGGVNATTYTIGSLTDGTEYTFQVRAVNGCTTPPGCGESDPATAPMATPDADAPAPPTGLTATARNTEITLTWTDPGNAAILYYEYQQKEGSAAFGPWTEMPGSSASTTSYRLTGLTNGRRYSYRLRVRNQAAQASPSSDVVTATPQGVPPAAPVLTATPRNGGVTLSWPNPHDASLLRWQYQYKIGTGAYQPWQTARELTVEDCGSATRFGCVPPYLSTSGATVQFAVGGLTNGTPHTFRIRAVNADGQTVSNEASATPAAGVPAKPTGLTTRVIPRLALLNVRVLEWDPAPDPGILRYEFTTDDGRTWNPLEDRFTDDETSEGILSYRLPDGEFLSGYTFRIRAVNAVGPGPASDPAVEEAQGRTVPVSVEWDGDTGTAVLVWAAFESPDPQWQWWEVLFRERLHGTAWNRSLPIGTTRYQIPATLNAGDVIEVTVSACVRATCIRRLWLPGRCQGCQFFDLYKFPIYGITLA